MLQRPDRPVALFLAGIPRSVLSKSVPVSVWTALVDRARLSTRLTNSVGMRILQHVQKNSLCIGSKEMNKKRRLLCAEVRLVCTLAVLFCVAGAGNPLLGQSNPEATELLPEGELGDLFREFVDAMDQENDDAWLTYVESHMSDRFKKAYSQDDWKSVRSQLQRYWKSLEFVECEKVTDYQLALIGKDPNDPYQMWLQFVLVFDAENPGIVVEFDIQATSIPSKLLEDKISEQQLVEEMEAYLAELTKSGLYSGAMLIAKGEKVVMESVAGFASLQYEFPNRIDTKFCLGSMTKMFTAVAIMKLWEAEKISLDDPIGKYLGEEWVSESAGDAVQIKHLLTHTGGVGDFFLHPEYGETTRRHFTDVASFSRFIDVQKTEFEPGSKWEYSNSGFILLGAIIEKVTGQDYHEHMQAQIYEPHGLSDTDCYFSDRIVKNLAQGYYVDRSGEVINNVFSQRIRGCPAGSSYSTVHDLHRFSQKLLQGKIVSPAAVEMMTEPKPDWNSTEYGLGFECFSRAKPLVAFGHTGGGPGVSSRLEIYPKSQFVLVCLTNHHQRAASAISNKFNELLRRLEE